MDVQEVIQMHTAGMSVKAISDEVGASENTIRKALSEAGLLNEDGAVQDVKPDVITAYQKGVSVPQILKDFGITYTTLYRYLEEENIPTRKVLAANVRERRMDTAVEMYQEGHPLWKITAETGIAQPQLHAELHTRGIALRRPRKTIKESQ